MTALILPSVARTSLVGTQSTDQPFGGIPPAGRHAAHGDSADIPPDLGFHTRKHGSEHFSAGLRPPHSDRTHRSCQHILNAFKYLRYSHINTFRALGGTMKIVIPGGTGHVGAVLERALIAAGHDVTVLTRRPSRDRTIAAGTADPGRRGPRRSTARRRDQPGRPQRQLPLHAREPAGHDGLARATPPGSSARPSPAAARPPRLWLQMSTATIYAHRFDAPNDEATGVIGGTETGVPDYWAYSVDIAKAWETGPGAGRDPRHAQGRPADGHGDEPGPRRCLRRPAPAGPARPRRARSRAARSTCPGSTTTTSYAPSSS